MLDKRAAAKVSVHLSDYSLEKGIYEDQLLQCGSYSCLIDLPTSKSIEEIVQLLKGNSSHWIKENKLVVGRFAGGRGYGAFSVSHSDVDRVARYIAGQEEHHRKKTFAEEYELFVKRYGLKWRDEEKPLKRFLVSQSFLESPG